MPGTENPQPLQPRVTFYVDKLKLVSDTDLGHFADYNFHFTAKMVDENGSIFGKIKSKSERVKAKSEKRKAKSEKRKAKSEKRKAKSQKPKAKSQKPKAKSEKRKAKAKTKSKA